ncbi:Hypothetical protein PHPALM_20821 [Phytophthora palmivora]|uniref:Chloride Channel (ClC) Family n=1 Tax=Phytophthora palmivora TaxID=4796 RepID=A0A2P4XDW1_9STRA|nr:Hypothetical protein PHPALM_20821 [Phytophthora palmivora]
MIEAVGEYSFGAFILWTMWCNARNLLRVLHFASFGRVGIPAMRELFAGVFQNPGDTLSFRTLVAKSLGTVLSSASGLSVGRAGPFTHIMSIIGYLMEKISIFHRANYGQQNYNFIRAGKQRHPSLLMSTLMWCLSLCSGRCGMTASFGSPLGCVLFGIEVTAIYYEIKCLWEGIICSSFCILVFHIIMFMKSEFCLSAPNLTWMKNYCCWSVLQYGFDTTKYSGSTSPNIQSYTKPSIQRRTFHVVSIYLVTVLLTFPFGIMRISDRAMVNELFHLSGLNLQIVYFVLKLMTCVLLCGAPFSCGVFGPLFTMGAAVGRCYGETLMGVWSPKQSPATYAVVGAACFAASATQQYQRQ